MPESVTASSAILPRQASGIVWWRIALLGAVLIFLWAEVVRHISPEWSLNPQYGYGWSVPFLSLFLLWKRWPDRPMPEAPASQLPALAIVFAGALCVFAVRFLAEANPDWRLLSWMLALAAMAISLAIVYLHGGWPWVRYFSFPFLFFLVAVPWPAHGEQIVIQNLMRAVTAINVSALNLLGVPALQHGNVIEITSGLIGIEEACSGVRSLQATLMISLFLGELYAFSAVKRLFLVVAGALLAFICNLARTAILVGVGVARGPAAIDSWHDPAGLTILLVCLFGLWGLSLLLRRSGRPESEPIVPGDESRRVAVRLTPVISLGICLLIAEAAVQSWYALHQPAGLKLRWDVRWPNAESGYTTISIPPAAQNLLHYNDGGGAKWNGSDGHEWLMYFFRWLPGRTAARFVKIHRPDICLPASGLTMIADDGIQRVEVKGKSFPVRAYRFNDHGQALHVFYCYWDARAAYDNTETAGEEDWSARGRLRAALRGQREIGAQMLEVVVRGYDNDADAAAALRQQLDQIVELG